MSFFARSAEHLPAATWSKGGQSLQTIADQRSNKQAVEKSMHKPFRPSGMRLDVSAHPCKAGALPAELTPPETRRVAETRSTSGLRPLCAPLTEPLVTGPGRSCGLCLDVYSSSAAGSSLSRTSMTSSASSSPRHPVARLPRRCVEAHPDEALGSLGWGRSRGSNRQSTPTILCAT
jgi:hypothetical protein